MATSDKITIEDIAKLFKLPLPEDVWEASLDYGGENRAFAYQEAIKEGESEEAAEEAGRKAEGAAMDEVYRNWHDAVEAVADEIFGLHHLNLVPVKKGERTPFEYRIQPVAGKTWTDVAYEIRATIHGVGMFEIPVEHGKFEDETPREWVLTRKHHMRYYPEVYGTSSATSIYERSWR